MKNETINPDKKNAMRLFLSLMFISAMLFITSCDNDGQEALYKQHQFAANEVNKECPVMVDAETRLDNALARRGNGFQYNYTLINYKAEDLDTNDLRASIEPGIINSYKTLPDLKVFRDSKTTMYYLYRDMEGKYLMQLVITPEMYAN
jgi:hypothetical protein